MTPSLRRFYLLAMWTPIVLPALAWAVFGPADQSTAIGPGDGIVYLLVASLVYGGVPYAVFAGWASWWLIERVETEAPVRRLMMWSPLILALLAGLAWMIVFAVTEDLLSGSLMGGIFALYTIALGYFYVIATVIVRATMLKLGRRSHANAETT